MQGEGCYPIPTGACFILHEGSNRSWSMVGRSAGEEQKLSLALLEGGT